MDLIIENIRSFAGRHILPLKPLTVLTGENSSGKSTLLGVLSVICDKEQYPLQPAFNKSPYSMGSFDTIATYKGGSFGRSKHFVLGCQLPKRAKEGPEKIEATYRSNLGKVEIAKIEYQGSKMSVFVDFFEESKDGIFGMIDILIDNNEFCFPIIEKLHLHQMKGVGFYNFVAQHIWQKFFKRREKEVQLRDKDRLVVDSVFSQLRRFEMQLPRAISLAPIRTKPDRTYSEIMDVFQPEGDHIPFVLDRFEQGEYSRQEKDFVHQALSSFGQESGLFSEISVKKLGKKASSPFQIVVKGIGRPANLVDVGYGVSQALPIIIQTAMSPRGTFLLVQQPEVHLHPRAQAALGTFFSYIASLGRVNLVIETHSDYIIDRIRQSIAKGNLKLNNFSLIFMSRDGPVSTIHNIKLDSNANIIDPPPCYREFFLSEELNILRRADY